MFKKPFSFDGRIRRTEYGLSYLLYIIFIVIISFIPQKGSMLSIFLVLFIIPLIWLLLAQGAKRCHDRGNTGWYQLIPFYGFWMLFANSDNGENQYGPNPKGIGNIDEVDEIGNHLVQ